MTAEQRPESATLSSCDLNQGVITQLQQAHREQLHQAQRSQDIDAVSLLAEAVRASAARYQSEPLEEWVQELQKQSEAGNHSAINQLLEHLSDLLDDSD